MTNHPATSTSRSRRRPAVRRPEPEEPLVKRIVIASAVVGLAVAGVQGATAAPSVYKVTGGGQITDGLTRGAGSTIAFSAQSQGAEGSAAKGQFQLQLRTLDANGKGTGKGGQTIHGTISCVVVFSAGEGGMAALGGYSRSGEPFRIDVTDNGQGGDATDLVMVRRGDDALDGGDDDQDDTMLCDEEDEVANAALGRGNVKIHAVRQ
jgi:hypothetical protein